ncbi:NRDE family protein [Marinilongibacter aquaticus]|uniref:NRDE family protein n=1 Tax=Marinilongibacter aquaticus TaxID=2975157 RepID=UPI0021BD9D15|nr:NRDE family protein [Marinilongibacter aquaticus]UBM57881.1 NRDE family protein [Marinilongibacter aquaticus]
MCVLTFVPVQKGFVLTNNRDEDPKRPTALSPRPYKIGRQNVVFPKDPKGQGTWIATTESQSLVLLNGGKEKHIPKPPYRHSRGLVVLDYLKYANHKQFLSKYNFEHIEPFTMLIFPHEQDQIIQIQCNTHEVETSYLPNNKPLIWSSSTLYNAETRAKRAIWFKHFLEENPKPGAHDLKRFHLFGGEGDPENDLKMNRNEAVKTLSLTQIVVKSGKGQLNFEALN